MAQEEVESIAAELSGSGGRLVRIKDPAHSEGAIDGDADAAPVGFDNHGLEERCSGLSGTCRTP